MSRVATGIKELDRLIEGGFPTNTVVLISGGPGTGKTLFGLSFLAAGASNKERSCYISFNENEKDLLRACERIKPLQKIKENESFIIKSIDLGSDVNVSRFIDTIEKYPVFERLVIDNLNKLLLFAETRRQYRTQLDTLTRYLREKVACSLLICETDGEKIDAGNGEAFECDGVINLAFLEFEEKPRRTLRIEKMRYTSFEPKVAYDLIINSEGLRLSEEKII
jgi:KaiC/GvpD/RAD55 family RecA-like ATPase